MQKFIKYCLFSKNNSPRRQNVISSGTLGENFEKIATFKDVKNQQRDVLFYSFLHKVTFYFFMNDHNCILLHDIGIFNSYSGSMYT